MSFDLLEPPRNIPGIINSDLLLWLERLQVNHNYMLDNVYGNNLIINGDFSIPQRGVSFTAAGYTLDRWQMGVGSGAALTLTQQSFIVGQADVPGEPEHFVRINRSTAGSSPSSFSQRIEGVRTLANKDGVIVFYAKADADFQIEIDHLQSFGSGGSATVDGENQAINLTTSWRKFELQFTPASISGKTIGAGDYLAIRFIWRETEGATGQIDIATVQVKNSNTDTDFERRQPAIELLMCQRYFTKTYFYTTAPGAAGHFVAPLIARAHGAAADSVIMNYQFDVPMRAGPAITIYNPATGAAGSMTSGANTIAASAGASTEKATLILNDDAVVDQTVYFANLTADAEL